MPTANFDLKDAHKFFAADCFNKVWDLISRESRTAEEDQQMILLNQASIWHWTQREDCTNRNLSIGYWQAARVYALVGDGDNARNAAKLSMQNTSEDEPFYLGYAYEALARAEFVDGNKAEAKAHVAKAKNLLERITDADSKKWLSDDLAELESNL